MAKKKRAEIAARGTKVDAGRPNAGNAADADGGVSSTGSYSPDALLAPGMNSNREQLTRRIFVGVEVVLCLIPVLYLGLAGVLNADAEAVRSLQAMLQDNPAFLVTFIAACTQPFIAYLLRIAYRHYERGDGGYAVANLIALLCGEMLLQNVVGIAGMAVLLWRVWGRSSSELNPWARGRGFGGVLADISGAIVVIVIAGICAFANWRMMNG